MLNLCLQSYEVFFEKGLMAMLIFRFAPVFLPLCKVEFAFFLQKSCLNAAFFVTLRKLKKVLFR